FLLKSGPAQTTANHSVRFPAFRIQCARLLWILRTLRLFMARTMEQWGVVTSKDGGKHWSVFSNLPLPAQQHGGCGKPSIDEPDVAVSPFDSGTIYASGVLTFICGPESDYEEFFLQSSNQGNSWKPVPDSASVFFRADAAYPQRLFAFNDLGLIVLTKQGWQSVSTVKNLFDLYSVPRHGNELLARVNEAPQRMIRSTDSGQTWMTVNVRLANRVSAIGTLDDSFRGLLASVN